MAEGALCLGPLNGSSALKIVQGNVETVWTGPHLSALTRCTDLVYRQWKRSTKTMHVLTGQILIVIMLVITVQNLWALFLMKLTKVLVPLTLSWPYDLCVKCSKGFVIFLKHQILPDHFTFLRRILSFNRSFHVQLLKCDHSNESY